MDAEKQSAAERELEELDTLIDSCLDITGMDSEDDGSSTGFVSSGEDQEDTEAELLMSIFRPDNADKYISKNELKLPRDVSSPSDILEASSTNASPLHFMNVALKSRASSPDAPDGDDSAHIPLLFRPEDTKPIIQNRKLKTIAKSHQSNVIHDEVKRVPSIEELMAIYYMEHPKGIKIRSTWNPKISDVRLFCELVREEVVAARNRNVRPQKSVIIESASEAAFGKNFFDLESGLKPGTTANILNEIYGFAISERQNPTTDRINARAGRTDLRRSDVLLKQRTVKPSLSVLRGKKKEVSILCPCILLFCALALLTKYGKLHPHELKADQRATHINNDHRYTNEKSRRQQSNKSTENIMNHVSSGLHLKDNELSISNNKGRLRQNSVGTTPFAKLNTLRSKFLPPDHVNDLDGMQLDDYVGETGNDGHEEDGFLRESMMLPILSPMSFNSSREKNSASTQCLNDCSGHGKCSMNLRGDDDDVAECHCDGGWIDVDCSVKKCPHDCSNGGGDCIDGKCIRLGKVMSEVNNEPANSFEDMNQMNELADEAAEKAIEAISDVGETAPYFSPIEMPMLSAVPSSSHMVAAAAGSGEKSPHTV